MQTDEAFARLITIECQAGPKKSVISPPRARRLMASSSGPTTSWIDFLPLVLIVFSAVIIMLSGRNRKLRCPDCETVFNAPAMDNKRSGMGWTLPYMGAVKCPKCGETRGRRDYQKVKVKEPKFNGIIPQEGSPSPSPP